ncbi:Ig-like domain-containing protein [Legionella bozemanae]|uniref:Protein with a bacterial immunoglobulin-like domain protein n=1 Tax=Legionella bozemanae TaxID=447 RepID=A0A0W0R9X8_LEGBO|nr:Ig-like domain-containing protein [Legionella bozemanae]KTC67845.1 protein with a bacterial immunoglobulin-like domain protein [Legionella bozemanae]STP14002.1 Bacterial Ig-like domain (group 2) [Legionella bozemanae]
MGAGTTTIEATFNNVSGNASLNVSAATLLSINVTPQNPSIAIGVNQKFTATGTYSDASTKNITRTVTWTSSNTAVGTISNALLSKGVATGVTSGSTTIQAIKNGVSGSTTLNVNNSVNNCVVQRREDSSSYWLGYDIFSNGAPMILNFSGTGINLTEIIVQNGVFSNVQVLDQNQLLIGTKPEWVSMTNPGFIDFYGPSYGPYEPFNSPTIAACQIVN